MTTSKDEIRIWLNKAKKEKATHMLVICDTFDYDDYPVFVHEGESVREVISKKCTNSNMQRLMEVYNLSMDIEEQINKKESI